MENTITLPLDESEKEWQSSLEQEAPEGIDPILWSQWRDWEKLPSNDFIHMYKEGLQGRNIGLGNGLTALNKYIYGTHRARYYLEGADSGVGKCLGKGTKIIMFDGTLKAVEDIVVGDILMGPDSKPRNVLSTCTGKEQMYWVKQKRGQDYRVNESHILSLQYRPQNKWSSSIIPNQHSIKKNKRKRKYTCIQKFNSSIVNLPIKNYLELPNKSLYQGWKAAINFGNTEIRLDPYFLGLWLGDGTSLEPSITTVDPEILVFLKKFAISYDLILKIRDRITYTITGFKGKKSRLRSTMQSYSLFGNKHIPIDYIKSSRENRLQLLAGLIDSDGHYGLKNNMVEITQKRKELAEQIVLIVRSLGLYGTIKEKTTNMKREDGTIYTSQVYRVTFSHCSDIPCKIARKSCKIKNCKSLTTHIKVEKDIIDDYFGFTIDGDRLFLLEDFTVTHNTTISDFKYILKGYEESIRLNRPFRVFYCSFEIGKSDKIARWISYYTFVKFGIRLPADYIMGRIEGMLVTKEHDKMILFAYQQVLKMMECIIFVDHMVHPTKIFEDLITFHYEKEGVVERQSVSRDDEKKGKKGFITGYKAGNNTAITILMIDHLALAAHETGLDTKGTMDKLSKYAVVLRNLFGTTIIAIQQFSPDLMAANRTMQVKKTEASLSPSRLDFGDSKATYRDADVVFGYIKPSAHLDNFHGFNLSKKSGLGDCMIVNYLLKNRYGASNKIFPLFLDGCSGYVYDLPSDPKNSDMQPWYNKAKEIDKLCQVFCPR